MPTKKDTFSKRLLSVAVLLGFLCIQFHSLSHIDLASVSSAKTHQAENTTTQITEHSSFQKGALVDCVDCVLAKHIQANIEENTSLFSDYASGLITIGKEHLLFDSSDHTFLLRAPPYTPFS